MKTLWIVLGILALLFALWVLWGWLSVRNIEEPKYTVLSETELYEIREYSPQLIAQTTVDGVMDDALNEGFRRIAAYIFGENAVKEPIAMTTPVTSQESEPIAMTVPVQTTEENEKRYTIAFVMPSKYTLDTLPTPLNAQVLIKELPAKTYAILTFSGYATEKRVAEKTEALKKAVQDAELNVLAEPILSQYNPPWTPWFMRRNEIWIEVKG